ncbi:FYVE zinc finger-domain-containing protein [Protomyces lactucae-debilis]|uniref:FYVE zinc finger-domain-containing protein n=1 Tax=Protomyces lactucae-debilis TaxID=2754530 RepID=A0A1Y2EYJ1_PROLT|nr:FYVE zinc finger-domain-containing protein [Protomyces lactucae-debilis]ORY76658.1 FYVE zinc finger-domain-containing protein [Protomyces lactucae-debilis]
MAAPIATAQATPAIWQADEAVASCPLCSTAFSWWYRKHHCRRCGRVVCAACASNFCALKAHAIVRPPGYTATSADEAAVSLARPLSPTSTHTSPLASSFISTEAVEEVRCCDACFSHLEQDRCRRMLGLDISSLDPRAAAQLIREVSTPSGLAMLATPPPSYFHVPAPANSGRGQHITVEHEASVRSHRRRSGDGQESMVRDVAGRSHRHGHRHRRESSVSVLHRPGAPSSAPVGMQLAVQATPLRYVAFKLTLQDKILGEECPICFEEYAEGEHAARLECWCVFHAHCIEAWRDTKDGTHGCPLHFHD